LSKSVLDYQVNEKTIKGFPSSFFDGLDP